MLSVPISEECKRVSVEKTMRGAAMGGVTEPGVMRWHGFRETTKPISRHLEIPTDSFSILYKIQLSFVCFSVLKLYALRLCLNPFISVFGVSQNSSLRFPYNPAKMASHSEWQIF